MGISRAFRFFLDLLLPQRERTQRAEQYEIEDIELFPAVHELLGVKITTLLDYRNTNARDLVQSLKYDRSAHAAKLCAEILEDFLREEIVSLKNFSMKKVVLIPLPLHKERKRERGFNQIERVVGSLPSEFHDGRMSVIETTLIRSRATKQQTHLSRKERLENVADAFEISDAGKLSDAHVFLIDDVATTGATLREAAKPLMKHALSVTLIALARA